MTDSKRASSVACLNCGAALAGPFCSQCGQRAIPAHPTVRELVGDAWDELVGWDGKFLRTMRLLVLRPGELTRSAIEGRRARFITPVRLYLICGVLYFLVSGATPVPAGASFDAGVSVGVQEQTTDESPFDKATRVGLENLTSGERAEVDAYIAAQSPLLRPMFRSVAEDASGFRNSVDEAMPRALFLLVPLLAAVLGLFYRRRRYPEHLYTALHLQTFVFLVLTLSALAQLRQSLVVFVVSTAAAGAVIVGHAVVAQHRVYAESWIGTVLKAIAVAALYLVLWSITSIGAAMWVAAV